MKTVGLFGVLLVLCILVATPFGFWRLWRQRRLRRRRELFRQLAHALQLSCYDPDDDPTQGQFPAGSEEADIHIGGIIDGFAVNLYDHLDLECTPGASTETQTVVKISGFGLCLPVFRIMPADGHDRAIHSVLGTKKISIPEDAEFCRSNTLTGHDREAIAGIFQGGVTALFRENTDLWAESTGESLRFSRYEAVLSPDGIKQLLSEALKVAVAIRDAAGRPPANSPKMDRDPTPQDSDELLAWWAPGE